MAAAYASLLSLFHTLNQINIHPSPPISLDQTQVESLTHNLTFLKDFLERYPTYEDDELESRITTAAYAAEDIIETHIVDQIHARSNITAVEFPQRRRRGRVMDLIKKKGIQIKKKVMNIMGADHSGFTSDPQDSDHSGSTSDPQDSDHSGSTSYDINTLPIDLHQALDGVIGDMYLIKTEVMHIIPHLQTNSTASLPPAASTLQSTNTPVFDDAIIIQLLDKLVGQQSSLQILPIVGMGGIGKTTLAQHIYKSQNIVHHFDILAWVTISQEYSVPAILRQILFQGNKECEMSDNELGERLHKKLWGRRYLIVMDDIWSVEAFDHVKCFFPDNNDGSRIMITTRLLNLASELSGSHIFQMQFLPEHKSWDLLCETVFDKQDCPTELEDIGKQIAKKCRGLPLSIAVIGGLLKKSKMTRAYWIYTLENLNSLVNLENDEYAFRILRTSYKELLMHLKPCFLYMGIFPEDMDIKLSVLIKLWVAEGILRPVDGKSLEEVAKEYLKELIDRNLVLVSKLRWDGEAKMCKIHDVLRDVCLREAQKQKFFCMLRQQEDKIPKGINTERRMFLGKAVKKYSPKFLFAMESASLIRSLLYTTDAYQSLFDASPSPSLRFRLLRVYSPVDDENGYTDTNNVILEHANLRYLSLELGRDDAENRMRYLGSLLWNLQTLEGIELSRDSIKPTFEIWKMPLLRHVKFYPGGVLSDPPSGELDKFVLENLQTLSGINNLKLSEEVVKRIPNIKKLILEYERGELDDFCLHNLGRLQELEDLSLKISLTFNVRRSLVSFPHSLKKLNLCGTELSWEELTIRIGPLPHLQFLSLAFDACRGAKWETVEGHFCSLRLLKIWYCRDLKYWETDCTHFPRLEYLQVLAVRTLVEVPLNIGDIPTLKRIEISCCRKSAIDSVKRIKEEQEENENEDLQVEIGAIY